MEQLFHRYKYLLDHQQSIYAVMVVLTILIAWVLGQLIDRTLHQVELPVLTSSSQFSGKLEVAQGKSSYFFGTPETIDIKVEQVDVESIKETRLNLVLVGVMDLGARSVAIFKKSGNTILVSKGDDIQANVTLVDVLPSQVIINNKGVRERLQLEDLNNPLLVNQQENNTESSTSSDFSEAKIQSVMQEIKKSPLSLSKYVGFEPQIVDGEWRSIRVWPNEEPQLFNELGFHNGDEVVSVNNIPISDFTNQPSLWQKLLQENEFNMVVMRDGVEQQIAINLNE